MSPSCFREIIFCTVDGSAGRIAAFSRQATVERGFSVNRNVETVNMHEEIVIAQRIIIDHISSIGGLGQLLLSKELPASASAGRQRYAAYLDEQKKLSQHQEESRKRKAICEEIVAAKHKKKRLEEDIQELQKSADDLAMEAEKKGKERQTQIQ